MNVEGLGRPACFLELSSFLFDDRSAFPTTSPQP